METFHPTRLLFLNVVKRKQGHPIKQDILSKLVGLCPRQLIRLIKELERDGLLIVDRSEGINAYSLTTEGALFLSAAVRIRKGHIDGQLSRSPAMD